LEEEISARLKESAEIKLQLDSKVIKEIAKVIIDAYKKGKKVVLFGNGGSAADAQHIAAEFVGKYKLIRDPLPAFALSTNTSILTACGNDYGYESVFLKQVQAIVNPGDIVIGISTSGTSPNVLSAIEAARKIGAITVGFSGEKKDGLGEIVDLWLKVPSQNTPRIQESHITAGHIICYLVENELFGPRGEN
jgi:D-sedoheptulose 7-phosphate isomerase